MECVKCGGELRVTHTYRGSATGKSRRLTCKDCGQVHVSVETVQAAEHGKGARAQANYMAARERRAQASSDGAR